MKKSFIKLVFLKSVFVFFRIIDFLSQENCNLDFEQTELDEIKCCLQNFDSNDEN